MKIIPISLTIDGAVQRVFGSDIGVPLKLKAIVKDQEIEVSGIGFCSELGDVGKAWDQARHMCVRNLLRLTSIPHINLLELLVTIPKEVDRIYTTLKEKYVDETELALKLKEIEGPATKGQQQELDMLCEQLGIEQIVVESNENWNMIRVHALIGELKKRVKVYEVDVDDALLRSIQS